MVLRQGSLRNRLECAQDVPCVPTRVMLCPVVAKLFKMPKCTENTNGEIRTDYCEVVQ